MERRVLTFGQLSQIVNKEDYKKACLQSVEHHPSSFLSLAELAWISRHPVIYQKNWMLFNKAQKYCTYAEQFSNA